MVEPLTEVKEHEKGIRCFCVCVGGVDGYESSVLDELSLRNRVNNQAETKGRPSTYRSGVQKRG